MLFYIRNQLHGTYLRRSAQCSSWECIYIGLDRIAVCVDLTADTRYQMNDMTVVLHFLVEIDLYVMRIARKVVTGKVNQHDMLGILFRIGKQSFGTLSVQCNVSRAESRACNRVDACMSVGYLAVRFR